MIEQPYSYRHQELVEPDWRRLPGWADVTPEQWLKSTAQPRQVMGAGLDERFYAGLEQDQARRATMSMLIPPQMLNTMAPLTAADEPGFTGTFYADPVRRYMIPVLSDRRADW